MSWLRKILAGNLVDHVQRHYKAQRRDVQLEQSLHVQLDQSSQAMDRGLFAAHTTPQPKRGAQGSRRLYWLMPSSGFRMTIGKSWSCDISKDSSFPM